MDFLVIYFLLFPRQLIPEKKALADRRKSHQEKGTEDRGHLHDFERAGVIQVDKLRTGLQADGANAQSWGTHGQGVWNRGASCQVRDDRWPGASGELGSSV